MIAKLKQLLAECHPQKSGLALKVAEKANYSYLLQRATEEIDISCSLPPGDDVDTRLKMAIQLLNIARYKLRCNPSNPNEQLPVVRNKSSKTNSSRTSKGTTGTSKS